MVTTGKIVNIFLLTLICLWFHIGAFAQISVEEFKDIAAPTKIVKKGMGHIEFSTPEKGFLFTVNGQPLSVEEGDGTLMVELAKDVASIRISHPLYGELNWKIPLTKLKKKKLYKATLVTSDITKEYKASTQWLVVKTIPSNAMVFVDSLRLETVDGMAQKLLSLGEHTIVVMAPFYNSVADTITLDSDYRVEKIISLEPTFSLLDVKTNVKSADIYIDSRRVGKGSVMGSKLSSGEHTIVVSAPSYSSWQRDITVDDPQRVSFDVVLESGADMVASASSSYIATPLTSKRIEEPVVDRVNSEIATIGLDIYPQDIKAELYLNGAVIGSFYGSKEVEVKSGTYNIEVKSKGYRSIVRDVTLEAGERDNICDTLCVKMISATIKAFDPDSEILINREVVAKGEWKGDLASGLYSFSNRRDGYESTPLLFTLDEQTIFELDLASPLSGGGVLNISSNQVGAEIYLNGVYMGKTPLIIPNVGGEVNYTITLRKSGFKAKEQYIKVNKNDQRDIYIEMKKR